MSSPDNRRDVHAGNGCYINAKTFSDNTPEQDLTYAVIMLECCDDIHDPWHFMLSAIDIDRKGRPTIQLLLHRPLAITEKPKIQAMW